MKKIISCILSMCILLSCFTVIFAEDSSDTYDAELLQCLKGLNILPEYDEETFVPGRQMYTGNYLNGLLNIIGDYGYTGTGMVSEAKDTAYAFGLTEENFDKQFQALTLKEALNYSLRALGYKEALAVEDYPILSVYNELKKGIDAADSDILTQSQALVLLYNTAFASPLKEIIWKGNGEVVRIIDKEEALIYYTRKIYIAEGAVTKTSITSLDSVAGCGEERIAIGNQVYACAEEAYTDYLGYNVYAYVQEQNGGINRILYLEKTDGNNEVFIEKDMLIDVGNNCRQLSYRKDEENRRTVKLAPALKCIYNGRFLPDYKRSDFLINQGSITLIDRDRDGVYEVAKINAEEQMVVDTISQGTKTIFGKYTYTGALSKLVLDESKVVAVIKKHGKTIKFDDLRTGDVLTVQRSRDITEQYIGVTVSSDSVSGELNKTFPEDRLYIDDTEYEKSYAFMQAEKNGDKIFQKLMLGAEYKFLLDNHGKIAYAELLTASEEITGLLYKIALNEGVFSSEVYLRIYDTNGRWNTYVIAEKPVVNDDKKETAEEVYNLLSDKAETIVKFRLNADGEIKEVKTATETSSFIPNKFICSPASSDLYYTGDRSFNGNYFIDDKTILITKNYIPAGQTEDESDFLIQSYSNLSNILAYTYQAYGVDEFNRADVVYIELEQNNANTGAQLANLFVVTGSGSVLDNDEEVNILTGNQGGNVGVMIKEGLISLADAKPGDIISVNLDSRNYVNSYTKQHSAEDVQAAVFPTNLYVNIAIVKGVVDKIDPTAMYLRLTDGNAQLKNYRWLNSNNVTVNIYYKDTKTAEVATVADIEKGDYVVIRYNRNSMKDIVVIREN